MLTQRSKLGTKAEQIAGTYLQQKGYEVLQYKYRKKWGEIDIIARKGDVMVFVEVKANAKDFGSAFGPEVRVDKRKMDALIKTATLYLAYELKRMTGEWRGGIIFVTFNDGNQKAKITHFKNVAEAFQ